MIVRVLSLLVLAMKSSAEQEVAGFFDETVHVTMPDRTTMEVIRVSLYFLWFSCRMFLS